MKIKWEEFEIYTDKLVNNIKNGRYVPDVIIAVGLSGLIPATLVAKQLNVKCLQVITISSYDVNNIKSSPNVVFSGLSSYLKNKKVLIVDDIMATGDTFELVKEKVSFFKPKDIKLSTPIVSEYVCKKYPDFYGESILRAEDDFICLPWD